MTYEEINDLVSKYADELYEGYDMADFQNEENKETVTVICAAFLGHILETHDIIPKSPESATMVGWVARDEDGDVNIFDSHPVRRHDCWMNPEHYYLMRDLQYQDPNIFPSVTWESEPLKVELTITPIEDE